MQSKNANAPLSSILQHVVIVLHGLCIALAIGHRYLEVPTLLMVFGRAHPLMLHFPIVLLLLLVVLLWSSSTFSRHNPSLANNLFLLSLCLTGATVFAGLLLAAEDGYNPDDFFAHQWVSMGLFWMASIWYLMWKNGKQATARMTSVSVVVLTLIAGHLGATLTHGEDFLWAPFVKTQGVEMVALEEAIAFDHVILPILEQKCVSCHKASKQKGELRLDGASYILAGGKHGPVIDTINPRLSSLLQRILLPLDHEEHMPPKGKIQLTVEEIDLIRAWIDELAPMEKPMISFDPDNSFFQLAKQRMFAQEKVAYSFPFIAATTIAQLNNDFRVIQPIYPGSPALRVSFFGKSNFKSEQLEELTAIKNQVVELNLSNMPLAEDDLKKINQFDNLEKLHLNGAGLQGKFLHVLADLKSLRILSLAGNSLGSDVLENLAQLTQLSNLFLWNTGLDVKQMEMLAAQLTQTTIELGYQDDGTLYQLNAPIIQANSGIFHDTLEIRLKHPIAGVGLFYTLDNTRPDSINYLLYEKPILLEKNANLRVRAFAEGWLGSEESNAVFFKAGVQPSSYRLSHAPHPSYKGDGVETLFDLEKGDEDFSSGKWIGFQDDACEVILDFGPSKSLTSLSLSVLTAEASYIFPPALVEIWSKTRQGDWVLLHADKPVQPKQIHDRKLHLLEYSLPSDPISQLKAIIRPINRLPHWHPGAGQKGWVFLDEVLVN
ncbi:c-type cytochrome domain-containing protein [Mongoliitalea daihaiensis]|uniref:c-type cytochrome domain-containing protein n=1 Tax=Mongoliitalea daihaiensis TaxID=2782006 RepID=UPI001F490D22|nr:c-type cytochrome domain-containing protein [Mongoliitalea daihaiensis]UJP66583.1 cytochrome C [Mongoliitalea daihaiensis]